MATLIQTLIPRIDAPGFFETRLSPESVCDSGRQLFELNNSAPDQYQIATLINNLAVAYGQRADIRLFAINLAKTSILNTGRDPMGGQMADNDERLHADSIFNFVLTYMKFVKDPLGAEYVQSPYRLLKQFCQTGEMYGDCDDHVLLTNSLLSAMGIPTKVALIKANSNVFNHVITMFKMKGQWRDFDGCNKADPFYVWNSERFEAGEKI